MDILSAAYLELVKKFPALNLVIAGSGPYLAEMKEELKSCSRVLFTGAMPRYELAELYNSADFFVFPSVTDTFGMVILEALACGLPTSRLAAYSWSANLQVGTASEAGIKTNPPLFKNSHFQYPLLFP